MKTAGAEGFRTAAGRALRRPGGQPIGVHDALSGKARKRGFYYGHN